MNNALFQEQQCGACHTHEESIRHITMECEGSWEIVSTRRKTIEQLNEAAGKLRKRNNYPTSVRNYHAAMLPSGNFEDAPWFGVLLRNECENIAVGSRNAIIEFQGIAKLGKVCYDGACKIMQIYRKNYAIKRHNKASADNGVIEQQPRITMYKIKPQIPGGKKLKRLQRISQLEQIAEANDQLLASLPVVNKRVRQQTIQPRRDQRPLYEQLMRRRIENNEEGRIIKDKDTDDDDRISVDSVDSIVVGKKRKRNWEMNKDDDQTIDQAAAERTKELDHAEAPASDSGRAGIG
jgi:hypothetical protein